MRLQIQVLNSVTQYVINGHTPLIVYWYLYHQKPTFERFKVEETTS